MNDVSPAPRATATGIASGILHQHKITVNMRMYPCLGANLK
jgi:hypothetical protein